MDTPIEREKPMTYAEACQAFDDLEHLQTKATWPGDAVPQWAQDILNVMDGGHRLKGSAGIVATEGATEALTAIMLVAYHRIAQAFKEKLNTP